MSLVQVKESNKDRNGPLKDMGKELFSCFHVTIYVKYVYSTLNQRRIYIFFLALACTTVSAFQFRCCWEIICPTYRCNYGHVYRSWINYKELIN
ncbi:hypothetical protein H5410_005886 [Solanum commersonii]|uniref:Uncharacterized protein n=1 Tax=Solanum commersonii TaxID=4109 RepID=A0A9J6A8R3_SOLCO|nr:hypothetical protein H5410_005886 [Solanum commersonii]